MRRIESEPRVNNLNDSVANIFYGTAICGNLLHTRLDIAERARRSAEDLMTEVRHNQEEEYQYSTRQHVTFTEVGAAEGQTRYEAVAEYIGNIGLLEKLGEPTDFQNTSELITARGQWIKKAQEEVALKDELDSFMRVQDRQLDDLVGGKLIQVVLDDNIDPSNVFVYPEDERKWSGGKSIEGVVMSADADIALLVVRSDDVEIDVYAFGKNPPEDTDPKIHIHISEVDLAVN